MKYFLFLFSILLSYTTCARKIEGYVVLKNSDTLKCEIVQNFAVISGIDVASFQYGIRVVFDDGHKQNFMPGDIKAFGIYIKNDVLHFVSVRVLSSNLFKGEEEKQVFMRIIQRGHIKVYYFIDLISSPNGPVRTPVYAVQLGYNEAALWLEMKKNEFGKNDFKSFFKEFIPEYYSFFESLSDRARLEEVLDKIRKFNRAMIK
ncbi:hypothetical protein [Emticicia sp. BO119]|uniref:hypothetical protein n=1 Tax=Emticicia sp. BO119 TaxID=2757768 RepID=UPI0015F01A84|nr:hypothetical protein [Emticicia sp. BO119]MBA4849414.1 hypothetical protein [Emticicia sp. BO119]